MADGPETPGDRQQFKLRFGRDGAVRPPRRKLSGLVGSIAALAIIVGAVALLGPSPSKNPLRWREWLPDQREAKSQPENEEKLKDVQQVEPETTAGPQGFEDKDAEDAWAEFDKRMQSVQPTAPREEQGEELQASAKAEEDPALPDQKQSPTTHQDAVVWLSVSPDGSQLLSASTDRSIKLWDVKTGLLTSDVGQHADMARSALFLPGGREAVSGADDGMINIWSVGEGKLEEVLVGTENGGVRGLAVSADGAIVVSSHETGTIVVWNLKERRKAHVLNGRQWPANAVAISPDGKLAVSGDIDGVIRTWDLQTGKLLRFWKSHERGIYGAAILADGKQAITASGDGLLKLWTVENGREIRSFPGHAATVYAVAISADGKIALSGSLDASARLWDLTTGEELAFFDNIGARIYSVALLADGSWAIGDERGTIKIVFRNGGAVRKLAARSFQ